MLRIFRFEKRNLDWWGFTLLPILIMIPILMKFFFISKSLSQTLILLLQQLFSYSIVLGCADLGLKFKSKERNCQITPSLVIIIFSSFFLFYVYTSQAELLNFNRAIKIVFFIFSFVACYFSIVLYNKNPENSDITAETFTDEKEAQEDKAKKLFESSDKKNSDVKWGENE